jgi:general secretion pathway protein G
MIGLNILFLNPYSLKNSILKMRSLTNSRGMTLIEILIVMAIIGTLMATLLPRITARLDRSKVENTKIAMGQITSALNLYYADCSKFPDQLESLSQQDDCPNWDPSGYLKKVPKDGWNRDFIYESSGGSYSLMSLGSDGRPGGEGFAKDIRADEL